MPVPRNYQPYDDRCRSYRDLGRAYYVPCELRASGPHTHHGRVGSGNRTSMTWGDYAQCSELHPQGWRCQLIQGHGTYHRAIGWDGTTHNFGTKAEDYVARIASDNLAALASNALVGPCMDSRMLSPGYTIQCVLSKGHGYPHMIRFGSIVHTWGYETQCPVIDPVHKLRCLKGNGHTELHFSVNSINGQGLHWVEGAVPVNDEGLRQIQEQQTLLDPGYIEVLKQRALEHVPRPRTYAERKRGRR